MFVKMAEEEDNKVAERRKGDVEGILIFVSASIIIILRQSVRQSGVYRAFYSLL